jgi:methylenetetrahydrofolate dehydrogenase (NADP+)/methenyltetrahydrofolate cyclohydrolase/formyltetrahydrofolate synthetase/formate--tetrahydrofolate ligase
LNSSAIPSDLDIAQAAQVLPITEIADRVGIMNDELIPYGHDKAKVHLDILKRVRNQPRGRYVNVTAITPTPLGEGKTTTTIGLTQGLGARGRNVMACIRQPSMGPTFGIKGGAAGGGYSQVIPMEEFNLHLTGDLHAISVAHNLAAAAIDARWYFEQRLNDDQLAERGLDRLQIDPHGILWRRVVDVNDRALRNIVLGLGGRIDGLPRETGYDITVASEIMAILALVDGQDYASALRNLRERCSKIVFGASKSGDPLTLEDLGVAGAVTVLMKDALHPTLMQTLEGQGVFVHAGPFANIAHGNSSVLADRVALQLADYTITESGFGADMGMEKFFDIKCRTSGLVPDCVVLTTTIRALKAQGGGPPVKPGRPMHRAYVEENLPLLGEGVVNLQHHLNTIKRFGIPAVVAINVFPTDTQKEIEYITSAAVEVGAHAVAPTTHWADGGQGALQMAEAVEDACTRDSNFSLLYPNEFSLKQKIETIARNVYGAADVSYTPLASRQLAQYEKAGFGDLPICMAKTHLSISHDPNLRGAPRGYTLPIREVRASVGAGFIYPLVGAVRTMPGLSSTPAYLNVDIDSSGKVVGLF